MAGFLGCRLNDRLAAVGLVSATVQPVGCTSGQAMPVIAFAGTADPLVPYSGGKVSSGGYGNGIQVQAAEVAIAEWAALDGCTATPTSTVVASDVTELAFAACASGLDVRLYRVEGGGHAWPGAPVDVARLGVTTHSVDATQLMLDFFAAHTRSRRQP
jgi:polyhydroxybutyrate depolymerase